MDLAEFDRTYNAFKSHDKITILCDNPECPNPSQVCNKTRAKQTILANAGTHYYCRSCAIKASYHDRDDGGERAAKISTAHKGKVLSPETRAKMRTAKKAMYASPKGDEFRKALSRNAAEQQARGPAIKFRIAGWRESPKAGLVYYGSSYELAAQVLLLDANPEVVSYKSQIPFETESGFSRCMDLLVAYADGSTQVVEVKPSTRMAEVEVRRQIKDNWKHAVSQRWKFAVWTEKTCGFDNDYMLRKWANAHVERDDSDQEAIRKRRSCERAKEYRDRNQDRLHIEFFCDYCQETHRRLKRDFENNVAKNGRFICHTENAHKPKPSKAIENPYSAEGKKRCGNCKEIKTFEEFASDKSKKDGFSRICTECNRRACRERYERKRAASNPSTDQSDETVPVICELSSPISSS